MTQNFYALNQTEKTNSHPTSLRKFILRSTVILLALSFLGLSLFAQNPLSGQIVDTETGMPLPYATVSISDTSPFQETVTDEFVWGRWHIVPYYC